MSGGPETRAGRSLQVLVDGTAMPPDEGRAFWERFSAHMEEHKGDLAGFAKAEGFASVHPAMKDGAPVLLASRTSAQRPYASVAKSDGGGKAEGGGARGGSSDHQGSARDPAGASSNRRKHSKQRG